MDQIKQLLIENWPYLVTIALAGFAAFARQTKTKSDDEVHGILAKLWQTWQKSVDKVTLNKGPKSIDGK